MLHLRTCAVGSAVGLAEILAVQARTTQGLASFMSFARWSLFFIWSTCSIFIFVAIQPFTGMRAIMVARPARVATPATGYPWVRLPLATLFTT